MMSRGTPHWHQTATTTTVLLSWDGGGMIVGDRRTGRLLSYKHSNWQHENIPDLMRQRQWHIVTHTS
jgi:hypothetical protein